MLPAPPVVSLVANREVVRACKYFMPEFLSLRAYKYSIPEFLFLQVVSGSRKL
jgi:hypothetical protein